MSTADGPMSTVDPLVHFREWLGDALASSPLHQPRAFCLSTIDGSGSPDARFVDLKEVTDDGFIFGTHLESNKAAAMARHPSVAMTFWWDHIGRQVRITGVAREVSAAVSDAMFAERSRDARLVSIVSAQSRPLADPHELERLLEVERKRRRDDKLERPATWGGYSVEPFRMEFLTFAPDRLHRRQLYVRVEQGWRTEWLQP